MKVKYVAPFAWYSAARAVGIQLITAKSAVMSASVIEMILRDFIVDRPFAVFVLCLNNNRHTLSQTKKKGKRENFSRFVFLM